jgi:ABC-type transporter Mla MlaB component
MQIVQHDSSAMFRFVLRGELTGKIVQELQHAWITARSILGSKELVVDVSGITKADPAGVEVLIRMRESGARLTAGGPTGSAGLLRTLGVPQDACESRPDSGSFLGRGRLART